ncbi:hypothetical protein BRPE64_ACDS23130 [Caballeronia insecticola]|uniref:Uncharacterized protein n=1 Tax=Caballeronia insecticola TaxID=758793 RepID=R4WZV3_9BURK|nr:hypothetical protein BRPE64_ACDS23130 [Caballeronia insecticola]
MDGWHDASFHNVEVVFLRYGCVCRRCTAHLGNVRQARTWRWATEFYL